MKIIFNGKVSSIKESKDKKYVNFGDMDTFSPINLGLPASINVKEKGKYHVECEGQFASSERGLYFRVDTCSISELKGGE